MKRNKFKIIVAIIAVLVIVITVLIIFNKNNEKIVERENNITKEESLNYTNLSAWVVYWDLDVKKEIKSLGKGLENVCYFAGNFDENNKLYINEDILNYYNETKKENYNKYITIVNDKVLEDGSSSLKDIEVLEDILFDEEKMKNHLEEVINLAKSNGFDGVEIDYEQMKNNTKLWDSFMIFISNLYERCQEENLKLRVLLEPNIPFDDIKFVEGPTYVMMCYNLHGGFSEPGEKANESFVKELIEKMESVPGEKNFAIATGGFDWDSEGGTKSITEIEARSKIVEYDAKVERDKESDALVFKYEDENKVKHEVWYSDTITISKLAKVIKDSGYDVSIWRLGGNIK